MKIHIFQIGLNIISTQNAIYTEFIVSILFLKLTTLQPKTTYFRFFSDCVYLNCRETKKKKKKRSFPNIFLLKNNHKPNCPGLFTHSKMCFEELTRCTNQENKMQIFYSGLYHFMHNGKIWIRNIL